MRSPVYKLVRLAFAEDGVEEVGKQSVYVEGEGTRNS